MKDGGFASLSPKLQTGATTNPVLRSEHCTNIIVSICCQHDIDVFWVTYLFNSIFMEAMTEIYEVRDHSEL